MKPDNEMDELFKNLLSGHVSAVPENMWERIVRKKDEDRKGFIFFFRLLGIFILGFVIAGVLLIRMNGSPVINKKPLALNSQPTQSPDTSNTNPNRKDLTVNHISQNKISTESRPVIGEHNSNGSTLVYNGLHKNRSSQIKLTGKDSTPAEGQNQMADPSIPKPASSSVDTNTVLTKTGGADSIKKQSSVSDTALMASDSVTKESTKKSDSANQINKAVWSVDVYGSPDYPFVFGQSYEQMRLSYTIGFRLNRSFGKRFSGTVGIQYSVVNFYGSDSLGGPGLNHLKRLDIPVLVGYTLGSNSITTVIHAGLIFNLNTKYQSALTYYPDYFKTNTGLGAYLGVNLEKHINYHFSVFGEPYLRFQITPMTDGGNSYINVTGLSLGLRYYFKK